MNGVCKGDLILRLEIGRACHQDIGTIADASFGGFKIDTTVDLQLTGRVLAVDHFPDRRELWHHVRHELLAAKARLHGHDQDEIDQLQIRRDSLRRGLRLYADSGADACLPDDLQCLQVVLQDIGFDVDCDDVRPGLAEFLYIADRSIDHQMNVQRQIGDAPDRSDDGHTNGDIRDKCAVHHVHVDIVRTGLCQGVNIPLQIDKICRENRGSELNHT